MRRSTDRRRHRPRRLRLVIKPVLRVSPRVFLGAPAPDGRRLLPDDEAVVVFVVRFELGRPQRARASVERAAANAAIPAEDSLPVLNV
jgi:hypothetical protein